MCEITETGGLQCEQKSSSPIQGSHCGSPRGGKTNRSADLLVVNDRATPFPLVTQKVLYTALLRLSYKPHAFEVKWRDELPAPPVWRSVWRTVHDTLVYESTRSAVWEQIHLNFFTQYNFNKWHSNVGPCSFCRRVPRSAFHIVLYCPFIQLLCNDL